jgi:hypothetical protein
MSYFDTLCRHDKEKLQTLGEILLPAFVLTVFVSYLYVFMEWLFFATKPSYFDSFETLDKVGALLIPPIWLILAMALPIMFLGYIQNKCNIKNNLVLLLPTFLLGTLLFLMVDNFLYTLTRWGVNASVGMTRLLFITLYVLILVKAYKIIDKANEYLAITRSRRCINYFVIMLIVSSITILGIKISDINWKYLNIDVMVNNGKLRLPNIIFLASDGIEAEFLSLYGYRHKTTPFLEEFGRKSLVFENAFANASVSTGSQTSMLSGKLPAKTKVGFYPQVLQKKDAFQHLPAILQKLGYNGYQRTLRYYGDSGDLNMMSSFDYVNGRKQIKLMPGSLASKFIYLFDLEVLFAKSCLDRMCQRILHLFNVTFAPRNSQNFLAIDSKSVDDVIDFIKKQKTPFFVHLHLMGSHYGGYDSSRSWFKQDDFPEEGNRNSLHVKYMNAIRDADEHFRDVVAYLGKARLENTIIVVSSDHSQKWSTLERIPLILHFPKDDYKGHVKTNVSLVDVAPTILDYMGIEIPKWMDGKSLLPHTTTIRSKNVNRAEIGNDPILTLEEFQDTNLEFDDGPVIGTKTAINPGPPLYGVRQVGIIFCNQWRKMSLETGEISAGNIKGHTSPPSNAEMYSDADVRAFVRKQLTKEGFVVPAY